MEHTILGCSLILAYLLFLFEWIWSSVLVIAYFAMEIINAYMLLSVWTKLLSLTPIVGLFLTVSVTCICIRNIYQNVSSPLFMIPGPWYASFTALHLRYYFSTGEIWKYAEKMHKKYGPIIRLGPRQIWISDAAAVKQILFTIDLPKVAMYSEISRDRNTPGLFGEM